MMRTALLFAAVVLGACTTPTAPEHLAGSYTLVAFQGHEIPHGVVADTAGATTLTGGTLTLEPAGTFAEQTVQVVRYAPTVAQRTGVEAYTVVITRTGTWSARGDWIAFRLADGSGWDGTRDAAGLRYAASGQRFLWGRP